MPTPESTRPKALLKITSTHHELHPAFAPNSQTVASAIRGAATYFVPLGATETRVEITRLSVLTAVRS
jgi:hypothetical protein